MDNKISYGADKTDYFYNKQDKKAKRGQRK